ncbi:hypothetical protein ABT084_20420 [Streptomyces sp. NPDC002138]|uniref:hypothetical protein n=1 Tax=Streptomyces sp. NPDC002138 TaxID=3154410 RepID=UPI00332FB3D3
MSEVVSGSWPTADLDPIRRLKVISAATNATSYAQRRYEVPIERLWAVAADLENELPQIITGLRSFTITGTDGERISAQAVSSLGHREHFDVVLRPGWCLMQSKVLLGAMAAIPDGSGTTFAFMSGLRIPGASALKRIGLFGTEARADALLDRLELRIQARSSS